MNMNANDVPLPTMLAIDDVRVARARIAQHVHVTPVVTSETLDAAAGATLFFKCENLQKTGAFKARGATNAVFSLTETEASHGVVTHSSGNHAAALARAARLRGIPAHIVMPENASRAKLDAVRRYGGRIVTCAPTMAARESTAADVMRATGASFVHPYDDVRVMAGQGTAMLEFLEQVPSLDAVLCPVSGGGLLSGTAVVVDALSPKTRVVAAEPLGADDAARSLRAGRLVTIDHVDTIADGLRASLSARTFAHLQRHVDDVVTVTEEQIVAAMRTLWEVLKLIVEPSGAVPYAAVAANPERFRGQRVGILLSGGNLDLDRVPWQPPRP